jgi:hypothetical protein
MFCFFEGEEDFVKNSITSFEANMRRRLYDKVN